MDSLICFNLSLFIVFGRNTVLLVNTHKRKNIEQYLQHRALNKEIKSRDRELRQGWNFCRLIFRSSLDWNSWLVDVAVCMVHLYSQNVEESIEK